MFQTRLTRMVVVIALLLAWPVTAADDAAKADKPEKPEKPEKPQLSDKQRKLEKLRQLAAKEAAAVQGKWLWTWKVDENKTLRVVKEVKGNKETVTVYGPQSQVLDQHTVEFRLTRTPAVRIFTWRNMVKTAGPQKGKKIKGPVSYIYQIKDGAFIEADGLLNGQKGPPTIRVWQRFVENDSF